MSFFQQYENMPLNVTDKVTGRSHAFNAESLNLGFLDHAFYPNQHCIAILSNNEVLSLSEDVDVSTTISPVGFEGPDALRIFGDSALMTLICAARRVFPGQVLKIVTALSKNSFFLRYEDMDLEPFDVGKISDEMSMLCKRRCDITRETWCHADALVTLNRYGHTATHNLLRSRNVNKVSVAILHCGGDNDVLANNESGFIDQSLLDVRSEDFVSIWNDPYVHDTGVLFDLRNNYEIPMGEKELDPKDEKHYYHLIPFEKGLLLYLTDETFTPLPPIKDIKLDDYFTALLAINDNYRENCIMMNAPYLASLNKLATDHRTLGEFINVAEITHDARISEIAQMCTSRTRCIFVTGPSSSGKTIFANRLAVHLRSLAFIPVRISLDDFYRSEEYVPRQADGSPDFEHLEALDTECIQEVIGGLLRDEEVILPRYDFKGHYSDRKGGRHLKPTSSTVYIIEGIHALNEKICNVVPPERRLKIFIRPAGSLPWDNVKIVSPTDCRLIRRIARDAATRGCSAERTLSMWPSVRAGETTWIMDKQSVILSPGGTYMMSSLFYELLVLRNLALPLLSAVSKTSPYYKDARRLIRLLEPIMPIPASLVPSMSLLNEFLGGSTFDDFCF